MTENTFEFWAGQFGKDYAKRNQGKIPAYTAMWAKILARAPGCQSFLELGCGSGQNLNAIRDLTPPHTHVHGIELLKTPEQEQCTGHITIGNILTAEPLMSQYDMVFTRGVLIHIPPVHLPALYQRMVRFSNRYIMICEYFNPTPVEIPYRGHAGRLWKRDFAGELMNYADLTLVDYGFIYANGPFAQDNVTYFLLEKR